MSRRATPVEVDWERLDKTKFLFVGAGLFSGVTTCLFPLTVIKTRQMALPGAPSGLRGAQQTAQQIWRYDGIRGFYRGFGTVIFGAIPARGVYLTTLEAVKSAVNTAVSSPKRTEAQTAAISNFVGGAMARQIIQREGVLGLYRGFGASLATFVPSSAVWWSAYGAYQKVIWSQVDKIMPEDDLPQLTGLDHTPAIHSASLVFGVQTCAGLLAGCTSAVLTNPLDVVKTRLQPGGILRLRIFWQNFIILVEPQLVSELLRHPDFDKDVDLFYKTIDLVTSPSGKCPNLFSAPTDARWKLVRKAMALAFNPQNIRKGFHQVVKTNMEMAQILLQRGPNAVVDMDNLAQRASLDIIGGVGFDQTFNAVNGFGSRKHTDDVMSWIKAGLLEVEHRWKNPLRTAAPWLFPDCRHGIAACRKFQAAMRQLLADVKARGSDWEATDTSIAAHVLRIRDPDTGLSLPDEELLAQFGILFIAGFETTGHTIAWALYHISQHPEVEAKIAFELDGLGLLVTPQNPHPCEMTYGDLGKLKYLGMVIKESMRMLPATADGTVHVCKAGDRRLGPHLIPQGVPVWVPFYAVQNSSTLWDKPHEFIPERLAAEMGGPAGVQASEHNLLTLQPANGLKMHCIPRHGAA
ncbi:hypothetical protein WJX72_000390 [[Myrmecia] bisecta]|uniref:Cytochrome P450 n=1 Tax=[Myrmecia] bisecta TaxID=41462 RepID=A0AAW1PS02_9CHLO